MEELDGVGCNNLWQEVWSGMGDTLARWRVQCKQKHTPGEIHWDDPQWTSQMSCKSSQDCKMGRYTRGEDGASSHTCKKAQAARKELGIVALQHPPSSPYLNPIKNVWHQLKHRISRLPRKATNIQQLWEQVQQAWNDIDQGFINGLVDSMPKRVTEVQKSRGNIKPDCIAVDCTFPAIWERLLSNKNWSPESNYSKLYDVWGASRLRAHPVSFAHNKYTSL